MILSDGRRIDDVIASLRPPPPAPPPPPAEEVARLASIESLLNQLVDAMTTLPAPQVHVEPVDLGDLTRAVQAVTELRPGATAEDIAEALAARLAPQAPPDLSVLGQLKETLERLDFRMKGLNSPAFGSSGPSNISDNATREVGRVTVKANETDFATQTTLAAIQTIQSAVRTALEDRLPRNAKQFADGKYRTAGGTVALSLATPQGSFHLSNPAGSGRSITITEFSLQASQGAEVSYFKDATSTGTVASVFEPNRAYEGLTTTVGVLRVGVGVLSGGTQLSPITLVNTTTEPIDYTAVLLPGQSLAVRMVATTTLTGYGSCTWIEETL